MNSEWRGEAAISLTGGEVRYVPTKPMGHRERGEPSEAVDASDGSAADDVPQTGPVPRVCIDYFYVSKASKTLKLTKKNCQSYDSITDVS